MKVIHRSDTMLVLEDQPWLIGILMIGMVLIFAFGGMVLLASDETFGALMVQRVRLTLDRSAGTVTRTRRSVLGLTQTTQALDRLDRARVAVSSDSDGSTYRMELDFRDPAEMVPFTTYHTSGTRPEAMAQAVNDWLRTGR